MWDGKNDTKKDLKNAINNKINGWKNFENGEPLGINSQYLVSYTVRYFEPYAPYTTARYVRYKTKGKYKYAPIIERDTNTRINGVGAPFIGSDTKSSDKNNANYGNNEFTSGARMKSYIVLCGKMNMKKYKNNTNDCLDAVKRMIAGFYASKYKVTVKIPGQGEQAVQLYDEGSNPTAFNNYRWAFNLAGVGTANGTNAGERYFELCKSGSYTVHELMAETDEALGKKYSNVAGLVTDQIVGKLQAGCAYEVNQRTAKVISLYYPECYVGEKETDDSKTGGYAVSGSTLYYDDPIDPPKLITSKIKDYKGSEGNGFAWKKGNLTKTPGTSNGGTISYTKNEDTSENARQIFNFDNSRPKGNVLVLTYGKSSEADAGASLTVRYHLGVGAINPNQVTDWNAFKWMEIKSSTYLSDSGDLNHSEGVNTNVGAQVPGNYSSDASYYYVGAKFSASNATATFAANGTTFNSGFTGDTVADTMTCTVTAGNSGVVDLYYYGYVSTSVTSSPMPTATTYGWDDTGGGGGSWSSPEPHRDGGPVTGNGRITGNLKDAKGENTEDIKITSDLELGAEGEVTLPNGHFDGKDYVSNLLDTSFNTTSYLTKGEIERTTVDIAYTATAKRATPMFDENGAFVGLSVQSATYNVPVKMVYANMTELEVYEPESGKMYNYAFPNTDGTTDARAKVKGKTEEGECQKGTRSWKHEGDDYNVLIERDGLSGNVGSTQVDVSGQGGYTCFNGSSDTYNAVLSRLIQIDDPVTVSTSDATAGDYPTIDELKADNASASQEFDALVQEAFSSSDFVGKFSVQSMGVRFTKPAWDDGEDTGTVQLIDSVNDAAMISFSQFLNLPSNKSETAEECAQRFEELTSDISTIGGRMRPPIGGQTKPGYFELTGIPVVQDKLNTQIGDDATKPGPDGSSTLRVKYRGEKKIGSGSVGARYYQIDDVNKVILHTPVAIQAELSNASKNVLQLVNDKVKVTAEDGSTVEVPLENALGLGSAIKVDMDWSAEFTAYGEIDTKKYVDPSNPISITFDFPVYAIRGTNTKTQLYIPKNKEFSRTDLDKWSFYAPYWASEGDHSVTCSPVRWFRCS